MPRRPFAASVRVSGSWILALLLVMPSAGTLTAEEPGAADRKELDAAQAAAEKVLATLEEHGIRKASDVEGMSLTPVRTAFEEASEVARAWMSRWRSARSRLTELTVRAGAALYTGWRSPANQGPTLEALTRKKGPEAALDRWRRAVQEMHTAATDAVSRLEAMPDLPAPREEPPPSAEPETPPASEPPDPGAEPTLPRVDDGDLELKIHHRTWAEPGVLHVTLRVPPGRRVHLIQEGPILLKRIFGAPASVTATALQIELLMQNRFGERRWLPTHALRMERTFFARIVWENLTREDIQGLLDWKTTDHEGWRYVQEVGARATAPEDPLPPADAEGPTPPAGNPLAFAHRAAWAGGQPRILRALDARIRKTVVLGLDWLANHQSPEGLWEAARFDQWYQGQKVEPLSWDPDRGKAIYDVGVTGLALQAFLAAGITHRSDHPHHKVVRRGLRYLVAIQDGEGVIGPRNVASWIYNHATATIALLDAYALTGDPTLLRPARRAVALILRARNPYFGWRYGIRPGDNDMSVTAWMTKALFMAGEINRAEERAGRPPPFPDDPDWAAGVVNCLDKLTDFKTGRVGYLKPGMSPARPKDLLQRFPPRNSESITAAGLWMRGRLATRLPTSEDLERDLKSLQLVLALPPEMGRSDMYFWYWGAHLLAHGKLMSKASISAVRKWRRSLRQEIWKRQFSHESNGRMRGSYLPNGPWGYDGGRVYSTALCTMALLAEHRFDED